MEERMKKTLLAKWAIVLLVLAGVLIGCEQPTEYTVTETIPSIRGPGNLKATVATGAVVLTWDLVTDAEGYEIRRKADVEGGTFAVIKPSVGNTISRYVDSISDTNPLTNGTRYIYQVIAVSGAATRTVGVVQSGVSETAITTTATQFPAKGTATVVSPVTTPKVEVASNGKVLVTWTGNTNPAVQYEVIGNNSLTVNGNTASGYVSSSSGTYNAAIRAVLGDGTYYPASAAVYASAKYDVRVLSDVSATIDAARESSGTKVVIKFKDVYGATDYILEKTQGSIDSSYYGDILVPVSAVWTNVPTTAKVKIDDSTWQVTDTVPVDQTWTYRLIVQTATGVSSPSSFKPVQAVTPDTVVLDINSISGYKTREDDDWSANPTRLDTSSYDILIQIKAEPNAKYTVYRQVVGESNGTGSAINGDYEPVTGLVDIAGAPSADNESGILKLQYTPSVQRQQYNYKVVGVKTGAYPKEKIYSSSKAAKPSLYAYHSYNYYASLSGEGTGASKTQYYYIGISGGSNGQLMSGETITVYGRIDPAYNSPNYPAQSQPTGSTQLIGTAVYYSLTTMPTVLGSAPAGYYIRASAGLDINSITCEVK
jgi:hypothetical protein